jgi:hypothetical protein
MTITGENSVLKSGGELFGRWGLVKEGAAAVAVAVQCICSRTQPEGQRDHAVIVARHTGEPVPDLSHCEILVVD